MIIWSLLSWIFFSSLRASWLLLSSQIIWIIWSFTWSQDHIITSPWISKQSGFDMLLLFRLLTVIILFFNTIDSCLNIISKRRDIFWMRGWMRFMLVISLDFVIHRYIFQIEVFLNFPNSMNKPFEICKQGLLPQFLLKILHLMGLESCWRFYLLVVHLNLSIHWIPSTQSKSNLGMFDQNNLL